MITEVKVPSKEINTADRRAFTKILDNLGEEEFARRVLAFITGDHFEEITKDAFVSSNPVITKLDMADKTLEYNFDFPEGTKQFVLKAEGQPRLKYSFESDGIADDEFILLDKFEPLQISYLNLPSGKSIYLQSDSDNTVVKILTWT